MALIGQRLKALRLGARLTQTDAADAVGVNRSTVGNWEAGRNMPDLLQFRSLVTLYGGSAYIVLYGSPRVAFTRDEVRKIIASTGSLELELRKRHTLLMMLLGNHMVPAAQ